MSLWTECCVAGPNGLCGKPVRNPTVGALGACEEHSAHGVNCKCGRFFLASHTPGLVVSEGRRHTAFRCDPRERAEREDSGVPAARAVPPGAGAGS